MKSKEKTEHGDVFLPINSYHTVLGEKHSEFFPHWHNEMEVTLVAEGGSEYRLYSKLYQINKDDIVLILPHYVHSAKTTKNASMISDTLVFHPNYLGAMDQDLAAIKYLNPLMDSQLKVIPVIHPQDQGYQQIRNKFEEALHTFQEKREFYELKLKIQLLELFMLLLENRYIIEKPVKEDENELRVQIHQAMNYIHEHYTENLSISELARYAGVSESYYMFLFKEYVGMTCVNYINHYRMQKAAQELINRDKTILQIALEHGYSNISYFNRRFKAQYGKTPKQFRALAEEERMR